MNDQVGEGLIWKEDQDVSMKDSETTKQAIDTSKWGTPDQKEIIYDYGMMTDEEKLKVPYIERVNGNLCVKKG